MSTPCWSRRAAASRHSDCPGARASPRAQSQTRWSRRTTTRLRSTRCSRGTATRWRRGSASPERGTRGSSPPTAASSASPPGGAQVPRARTLVGLFFSDHPVRDYDDARAANHKAYASFFHGLLDRGVYVAPSGYEAMFPSLAHGDPEVAHTLAAVTETANALGDP